MTVLPGSLDYLYYNGILDHIPYEAYEYGFGVPNAGMVNPYSGLKQAVMMNGNEYLNSAQRGLSYRTFSNDNFTRQNMQIYGGGNYDNRFAYNPYGSQVGVSSYNNSGFGTVLKNRYEQTKMNLRESILNSANYVKESFFNSSNLWKGTLAVILLIATPFLMARGKKKPPEQIQNNSFWSKINPKNWFKK